MNKKISYICNLNVYPSTQYNSKPQNINASSFAAAADAVATTTKTSFHLTIIALLI